MCRCVFTACACFFLPAVNKSLTSSALVSNYMQALKSSQRGWWGERAINKQEVPWRLEGNNQRVWLLKMNANSAKEETQTCLWISFIQVEFFFPNWGKQKLCLAEQRVCKSPTNQVTLQCVYMFVYKTLVCISVYLYQCLCVPTGSGRWPPTKS